MFDVRHESDTVIHDIVKHSFKIENMGIHISEEYLMSKDEKRASRVLQNGCEEVNGKRVSCGRMTVLIYQANLPHSTE